MRIGLLLICVLLPATLRAEPAPEQPKSGFAAAFLIARAAEVRSDWQTAEQAFAHLGQLDAEPADFLHRQSILLLNQGAFDAALQVTAQHTESGKASHLARLLTFADAVRRGDLPASEKALSEINNEGLGQFIKPFFRAWLASAKGRAQEAYSILEKAEGLSSLQPMLELHTALIADQAGDANKARASFARVIAGNPSYRTVALASSFYGRHKLTDRRAVLLRTAEKSGLEAGLIHALSVMPADDPSLQVSNWQQGIGEVLFNIAALLQLEGANDVALPYLRVAEVLRPDFPLVTLLIADLKVRLGQYEEARALYARLTASVDVGRMAQLRLVSLKHQMGETAVARDAAQALVTGDTRWTEAWQLLGNVQLANGDAVQAEAAYSEGLDLLEPDAPGFAALLFARAQSRHLRQDWAGTEADLEAALKLDPDNATMLNYLGYLWADRGVRLDEAEELARRALVLLPDDADVLDTLGWVKFRQGAHDEAVRLLELAAELRPYDPTINDHLGDAYWAQGRAMEARFQWKRAMTYRDSVAPQLVSLEELRQKIAQGLGERQTAGRQ
jgi:tetratricopeptide (TPR) repeat protein